MNEIDKLTGFLTWHGDNLTLGDGPACVHLKDENGDIGLCLFEEALSVIERLDKSAYRTISTTLPWAVEQGYLYESDIVAWNVAMPRIAAWLAAFADTKFVVYSDTGMAYWPPVPTLEDARSKVAERSGRKNQEKWAIVPLPLALPFGSTGLLQRDELPIGSDINTPIADDKHDLKIAALASVSRNALCVMSKLVEPALERAHA
jgi:hypothetical protein